MKPVAIQGIASFLKLTLLSVILSALPMSASMSQEKQSTQPNHSGFNNGRRPENVSRSQDIISNYRSPKRPGHYTAHDWRHLIDSLWGPGLPTSTKLEIFDTFWGGVDRGYVGFPNLNVNWDSLRTRYRPEVQAGVSRGRFAGIMGQLTVALHDTHAGIEDHGIDSVNGISVHDTYLPGMPCFWPTGWNKVGNFGAALTPMPDSSLLVYRAVTPHPLGLVPGDIVLGYDRIPWKRLLTELLEAELPTHDEEENGTTPRSWTHGLLNSAGKNWGLFDTIDVVKYATGDTLHLSTAPLAGQAWNSLMGTEQVAVPGVRMPDLGEYCTWGVVENTSVGYIYLSNAWEQPTGPLFAAALKDLLTVKKVTGLIIDVRYNTGGFLPLYNSTLDPLFNFNPAGRSRWRAAVRLDPANHFSFSYYAMFDSAFQMQPDYYDRPIALLTGPATASGGEHLSFQMRFHPMVRMFGLPTSGSIPAVGPTFYAAGQWGSWEYIWLGAQAQSLVNNEGFLVHKGFPVDEEVWLTRDGVAKGEDDVVKRALQWIATISYGHDVALARNSGKPNQDTIKVTAAVENPQKHTLSIWSYLHPKDSTGVLVDSCQMYDDGLHNDGIAGDKVYGGRIRPPTRESAFGVSLRTTDLTAGTFRHLPNARVFFTNGPVVSKGWSSTTADTIPNPGDVLRLKFKLGNNGKLDTVKNVTATVSALDTMVYIGTVIQLSYGDLAPGQESVGTSVQGLRIQSYCPPNTKVRLLMNISTEGFPAWTDTVSIIVQAAATEVICENAVPTEYALSQNYPNPFNPSTTIRYELPRAANVTIKIFNALGEEVALLVNERKDAGFYQVRWNAPNAPSGVYFYRLKAGEYLETKKMILLK